MLPGAGAGDDADDVISLGAVLVLNRCRRKDHGAWCIDGGDL